MDVTLAGGTLETLRTGLAIVTVAAGPRPRLDGTGAALDRLAGGALSRAIAAGDLAEKPGSTLLLPGLPGLSCDRILLVSTGPGGAVSDATFRAALRAVADALAVTAARDAAIAVGEMQVEGRDVAWQVREATRILVESSYRFSLPGHPPKSPRTGAASVMLVLPGSLTGAQVSALRQGLAIAEGVTLARRLGDLPGNVCNPGYLADVAAGMASEFGLSLEILGRQEMEALGMGAFLAVGRASASPCRLIVLDHHGGMDGDPPVVLLGKAVTFDTGGVSLKPGASMDEMKFDMSGGGAVLGAMRIVAQLGLPMNVVGIVAAAENMPGGNATRPGDVVATMSGRTVEILNTDAEGRLLLCDALTYAERFRPAAVIDVATLTGACVIALGRHPHGLFANDDGLAGELLASGEAAGDRAWRLPVWDDYLDQLDSNFADLANIGGQPAGAVTAAVFLSRFAQAFPWAHLDIAGTAAASGPAKGSTGRPVPLLAEFLMRRAAAAA
jgi:leucyl aminopeptidase